MSRTRILPLFSNQASADSSLSVFGFKKSLLSFGLMGLVLSLSSCTTTPPAPVAEKSQQSQPSAITLQQRREFLIRRLLAQAEAALQNDQLMTPENDNAFDRYRAVLLMDPDNAQATSGMQLIIARYVQLGRDALGHSKFALAKSHAARVASIDADNPLLRELRAAIVFAEAQRNSVDPNTEFELPTNALDAQDVASLPQFKSIAERVKDSDESLLIVARNDAEGRWIYQQLREAAKGYRVRGDIRIGAVPKIVVQPPI